MHVIATAGHVDHGKSTLVQALTGADPDRLEEEHRRGLSIELGYCWTSLPPVGDVAFVDVPGHERFVSTMLAGVGPVPAVLFVVAADDPWMPQAAEHLAALDAIGVRHGVVAVTRADLADPGPAVAHAGAELAGTSLAGAPVVAVSGRSGQGLDELRARLVTMVRALPEPDRAADVRLWVDRCFGVRGAGTVVTGTLPAGRVAVGDVLDGEGAGLRVRGMQSLGRSVSEAHGVARVALNLTGDDVSGLQRGSVLVTPDAWHPTRAFDVRVRAAGAGAQRDAGPPPERPLLHIGAASVAAHCRPLADGHARLTLDRPLPLRVGDRALLRDPGSRRLWGVVVLDPAPPPLRRRGAARERARQLAAMEPVPDAAAEVARRGVVRRSLLTRIGVPADAVPGALAVGDWLVGEARATDLRTGMSRHVAEHDTAHPLDPGVPAATLAQRLGLPSADIVGALVQPPLRLVEGKVTSGRGGVLPPALERALAALGEDLAENPFAAPTAGRLVELGLDHKAVAAAAKARRLLRLADGVVLLPGAEQTALDRLRGLPQPFTASDARTRLETSRRVVLPLLDHLDRLGHTRRLPDDRRLVRDSGLGDGPDDGSG